jgi:hypothetical protein
MVYRDPQQARTIVYGRTRNVEGVRRPFTSGPDKTKLTLVLSHAGHEIDGFETFYFDEKPLVLDANGYVQTDPYVKREKKSVFEWLFTSTLNGKSIITCTHPPMDDSITVSNDGSEQQFFSSIVGNIVTLNDIYLDGTRISVAYQYNFNTPTARIRYWNGSDSQNVGLDVAGDYGDEIRVSDRFAGIATSIIDFEYDQDIYVQGHPKVSAVIRGKKLYDPRKDGTIAGQLGTHRALVASTWEWSENPALQVLDYARHTNGWRLPLEDINIKDIIESANVCDEIVDFPVS